MKFQQINQSMWKLFKHDLKNIGIPIWQIKRYKWLYECSKYRFQSKKNKKKATIQRNSHELDQSYMFFVSLEKKQKSV